MNNGNKGKISALFFAVAGMELSWLFAVAALLLALFDGSYLSLPHALAAFFLGTFLTLYLRSKNWRVITRLALHLLFFAGVVLHSLYASAYRWGAFRNPEWLGEFWRGSRATEEGLFWLTAVFVAVLFWSSGIFMARRPLAYHTVTTRFDAGIGIFILILILSGATGLLEGTVMLLLFPFFLCSLTAIALAHNRQGDARGVFLQQYRGSGPVITFAFAVLLGGSAVLLLFYPFLTQAAAAGYAALQHYGPSLSGFLGKLILTLFGYGSRLRRNAPVETSQDSFLLELLPPEDASSGFFELLLGWGAAALLVLLFLFVGGWCLWRLCRWLWSGRGAAAEGWCLLAALLAYLRRSRFLLGRGLHRFGRFCFRLFAGPKEADAAHFFAGLLSWGRGSGIARLAVETPQEYGELLGECFPAVRREIEIVVHCYQEEVYGGIKLNEMQRYRLRRAWRRLLSPRYWPLRLYHRLLGQDARPGRPAGAVGSGTVCSSPLS